MGNRMIFATSNAHKLEEVRAILEGEYRIDGLDVLEFSGEIPETGDTIEANALQKVHFIADYTTDPVFAEDTGLIVPALNGAPGVYSARYAGSQKSDSDNIALLLSEMQKAGEDRRAYFLTVLAYRDSDGRIFTFPGRVDGRIALSPQGNLGFGYDPVFVPEGYDQTFAQLGDETKNIISHRRRALDQFTNFLKQKGTG